jgi:regulator of replication initiation timing
MKISKEDFNQIIREEVELAIEEGWLDRMVARGKGAGTSLKGKLKGAAQTGVGKLAGAVGSEKAAGQLAKDSAKTKKDSVRRAQAKKGFHIVKTHYEEFENDLDKLGLLEVPEFSEPLKRLRTAIKKLEKQAAEE